MNIASTVSGLIAGLYPSHHRLKPMNDEQASNFPLANAKDLVANLAAEKSVLKTFLD